MSPNSLPEQMNAVVLTAYSGPAALRLERRPVPRPGRNEVLVKIAASPINPSDLSFLDGNYGYKKALPGVPGFEASGTVVAVGSGLIARYLHGRRVACVSQDRGDGVWAEYAVAGTNFALPLDDSVDLEQGAMSVVNPLTAVALIDIARRGGHKTIANTAAASALGLMINRLAREEGIAVINIVRRAAQVELLRQVGASLVYNSTDSDFDQQLQAAFNEQDVHLAFDAVAGEMTLRLLDALPGHSRVSVYGGLAEAAAQAAPGHLIFEDKVVDGFWLTRWLRRKNVAQLLLLWRRAQKLLSSTLKTHIRARYPLDEVQKAVETYREGMTGGKVLITPGIAR